MFEGRGAGLGSIEPTPWVRARSTVPTRTAAPIPLHGPQLMLNPGQTARSAMVRERVEERVHRRHDCSGRQVEDRSGGREQDEEVERSRSLPPRGGSTHPEPWLPSPSGIDPVCCCNIPSSSVPAEWTMPEEEGRWTPRSTPLGRWRRGHSATADDFDGRPGRPPSIRWRDGCRRSARFVPSARCARAPLIDEPARGKQTDAGQTSGHQVRTGRHGTAGAVEGAT